MTMLMMWAIAVTLVVVLFVLFAAVRNTQRREHRFAASGDGGFVPWLDGGGGNSNCDAGAASDGGCGDGGGGGGGGD